MQGFIVREPHCSELLIQQFSLLLRWVNTYFCRSVHNECSAIISLYYIFLFRHFDILAARLGEDLYNVPTSLECLSPACGGYCRTNAIVSHSHLFAPRMRGLLSNKRNGQPWSSVCPPHAGVIVEQTQWSAMVICLPPACGGYCRTNAMVSHSHLFAPPHAGVLANCCFCKK